MFVISLYLLFVPAEHMCYDDTGFSCISNFYFQNIVHYGKDINSSRKLSLWKTAFYIEKSYYLTSEILV